MASTTADADAAAPRRSSRISSQPAVAPPPPKPKAKRSADADGEKAAKKVRRPVLLAA